jgi:hypothetical protein
MTDSILQDVAHYYCVDDLPGATVVATRLRNIIDTLWAGRSLTALGLKYLQQEGLVALHRLATGQMSYENFRDAASKEQAERRRNAEAQRIAKEAEDKARDLALAAKAEQQRQQAERVRLARERDPKYIAKMKNQQLRELYGLHEFIEEHCFGRVMEILRRADAGSRFEPEVLVWLKTEGKAYFSEPLKHKFHAAEADFFISEYQRTHDPWMAVSASGHCRKSGRSSEAHELLASVPQARQKLPKLRSAICTTHGGAMRDLGLWDDALALGEQGHALTPRDYRPCTLLGAVHMETGNYETGHAWYEKAVERGAEERSIDADLRGIIMRADMAKREEIKRFLLRDDPVRFAWVNKLRS